MENQIIPKLSKAKKGWYVYINFKEGQKRYSAGLNKIETLKKREIEFKALISYLKKKIASGWNPYKTFEIQKLSLVDAFKFSLEKMADRLSPKTLTMYKGSIAVSLKYAKKMHFDKMYVSDIRRSHIRLLLEKMQKENKWSDKNRNKHLNHLKAVFSELLAWDIIEYNPAHNIKSLKTIASKANTPATSKENETIKKLLQSEHPYFFKFISSIFYTGIRPKELLLIRINMIDLENREITLPPEITKTNLERVVPINDFLLEDLKDIKMYPKDFYLFGSYRENGRGNIGKYIDFIPGPTPIKRDTATKRWKKLIKDGLGINVNMYSYKHKGADSLILAGADLDTVRSLLGHTSERTTKIYAKKITQVYKNEIIDKATEL